MMAVTFYFYTNKDTETQIMSWEDLQTVLEVFETDENKEIETIEYWRLQVPSTKVTNENQINYKELREKKGDTDE